MAGGVRREYLDWLRGVAVLIMIASHLFDSWTSHPDRQTFGFRLAMLVGGFGAPMFLFLAGIAAALAAASRLRATGDPRTASSAVIRRGAQLFGLAFLFRIQAWILGWSSPSLLLRVDILNIMGPSIAAAGATWRAVPSYRTRLMTLSGLAIAAAFLTPLVRIAPIGGLPDPVEAYFRPVRDMSNFVFFPSMAFVFAGAATGMLLTGTDGARERRRVLQVAGAGLLLGAAAHGLSYLPSPYSVSDYWTTSPSFVFLRMALMMAAIGAAYLWSRPDSVGRALRQLGRTSLFIYWIHVELIYGLISLPLHKALSLRQALVAFVLFSGFMLLCSRAKDRVVAWWESRRSRPTPVPVV